MDEKIDRCLDPIDIELKNIGSIQDFNNAVEIALSNSFQYKELAIATDLVIDSMRYEDNITSIEGGVLKINVEALATAVYHAAQLEEEPQIPILEQAEA